MHDNFLKPIVKEKRRVGIVIKNCTQEALSFFEPWATTIFTDMDKVTVNKYCTISNIETNNVIDVSNKILTMKEFDESNFDVVFNIDATVKFFDQNSFFNLREHGVGVVNLG